MSSKTLTSYLLTLHGDLQHSAIQHPFLAAAGTGHLDEARLCQWLVQDKYYQFGYVRFIGRLLGKIDLTSYAFPKPGEDNLDWSTFEALTAALNAIKDEIAFYDKAVAKWKLKTDEAGPNATSKEYVQLFLHSSREDAPLIHGLTVLWATEYVSRSASRKFPRFHLFVPLSNTIKMHIIRHPLSDTLNAAQVYGQAWSCARDHENEAPTGIRSDNMAAAALRYDFIPNWTSPEFKQAVRTLAEVVDAWAERADDDTRAGCEQLWKRVLVLETAFWPEGPSGLDEDGHLSGDGGFL